MSRAGRFVLRSNCGSGLGFRHYAPSFPLKPQTDFGIGAVGVKQCLAPRLGMQDRLGSSFGILSIVTVLRLANMRIPEPYSLPSGLHSGVTGWLSQIHAFDIRDTPGLDDPTGIFASFPNSPTGLQIGLTSSNRSKECQSASKSYRGNLLP